MDSRILLAHMLALAAAGMVACGTPPTDIVNTNTETLGRFQVTGTVSDNRYTGTVCVADPDHADEIARRVFEQLKSHALSEVTLDVSTSERPLRRYVWTPGGGQQTEPPPATVRCQ